MQSDQSNMSGEIKLLDTTSEEFNKERLRLVTHEARVRTLAARLFLILFSFNISVVLTLYGLLVVAYLGHF